MCRRWVSGRYDFLLSCGYERGRLMLLPCGVVDKFQRSLRCLELTPSLLAPFGPRLGCLASRSGGCGPVGQTTETIVGGKKKKKVALCRLFSLFSASHPFIRWLDRSSVGPFIRSLVRSFNFVSFQSGVPGAPRRRRERPGVRTHGQREDRLRRAGSHAALHHQPHREGGVHRAQGRGT